MKLKALDDAKTAAATQVDVPPNEANEDLETLKEQLTIGGKLVIPVGDDQRQKMLKIIRISETEFDTEEFDYFAFVPLLGKEGWNK